MRDIPFRRSIYHASADFAYRRMTRRSLGAGGYGFGRPRTCLWGSIFLVILLLFFPGCDKPTLTGVESDHIDTAKDPIQKPYPSEDPIVQEIKSGHFRITPVAEYKISGVLVSKESYSDDWESKISPMDLAIVWGKLAEPEYDQ